MKYTKRDVNRVRERLDIYFEDEGAKFEDAAEARDTDVTVGT